VADDGVGVWPCKEEKAAIGASWRVRNEDKDKVRGKKKRKKEREGKREKMIENKKGK
jgi:hypothetical protein